MGYVRDLWDAVTAPAPLMARAELTPPSRPAVDPLVDAIARAIAARSADFGVADALGLPPVVRAVEILCSQGAALSPVAYANGAALPDQPRIVARPAPGGRPYDFTYATLHSLVTTGDAYWRVVDRDYDGLPTSAIVADPDDVAVEWSSDRVRKQYQYRGQPVNADARAGRVELVHIPLGSTAGELHGTSPILAALDRLAVVAAVEEYAAAYFASGGVPEVVLKSGPRLDQVEASLLRAQYLGDTPGPNPVRVASGDVELVFPVRDPAASQLDATRSHAATEVARLLGIPGPLMLIETSGSSITYTNRGALIGELVAETLGPMYLAPIEQAWSDLVPAGTSVRFDARELQVADLSTRANVYKLFVEMGALDPTEVRVLEGFGSDPITSSPGLRSTPPPKPIPLRQVS